MFNKISASATRFKTNPYWVILFFVAVDLVIVSFSYLVINSGGKINSVNDRSISPPALTKKKRAIIFVGIFSAPQQILRRNALRKSWLNRCKENGIPCLFFTDGRDMRGNKLPEHIYMPLEKEQRLHKDLILAQSPGGINFALRYLWMLNWAIERYSFDYFLRVDDDYFVCMDRLLFELPRRPRTKLYWGYIHCSPPGIL